MATAATVKQVQVKRAKPKMLEASLEGVYEALVKILQRHAPPFRTDVSCMSGGKPSFQLAVPGAYGGNPVDLQMAAVILQKGYVGFYLMCIDMNDATKKKLSPALLKLLKGKACFQVKTLDLGLRKDIQAALDLATRLAVAAQLGATAHRLQASETPNPASDPGRRKGRPHASSLWAVQALQTSSDGWKTTMQARASLRCS